MKRKRIFRRRVWSMLLALCVLVVVPLDVTARTLEEMETEQSELEAAKQDLEAKLEQLRSDEADKRAYQEALQEKINVVQEQIDSARKDIDELNAHITELTMKLDKAREEIQSTLDQFKERLVVLYKAGNVGTLEILLNSSSLTDFAMRSELMKTMTEHDQLLMNRIEAYMTDTQDEREECEKNKQVVAQLKKNLESQQAELDELYAENARALAEIEEAKNATEEAIRENEEKGAAVIAEIEALIAKQKAAEEEARRQQEIQNRPVSYPTGGGGVEGFNPIWPLPGVSYVSCYYGGYAGHRGMDIAGPYGTPVVAAESGTVIQANDYDSWGQSWGYYVLIYHNGTFTTRYAHLSGLTVSNGQYVEKGQIVGYEGATGNVTGPHLHFEVYENGSHVDPMIYL